MTMNLSVAAGSLEAVCGGAAIGAAITATGNYRRPFYAAGGVTAFRLAKDASFAGSVHDVSVKVLTTGQLVPGAPTQVGSMFVTAERIVVACGSNLDGAFDALQIDWSDAEDHQNWSPTSANLAGGYTLPAGGRIVRGMRGARENVVWTLDTLWAMRFNGDPSSVYDLIPMGSGCGLIGPNAAGEIGGVWYWMTPTGAFFAYGGSQPVMLACTLARDLADNLAKVQGDKVYCSRLVGKNYAEIWWFYPDMRDGNECSRYVVYSPSESANGPVWSCGTFDRTSYIDATVFPFPLAIDTAGKVWYHEKDFTEDGGPRSWRLVSAYNKDPGADALIVDAVKPDAASLQGGYTITWTTRNRNAKGIFNRTYPAKNVSASTGQVSRRVKGEMAQATFAGTSAPAFWRMGAMLYDVKGIRKSK